MGRAGIEPATLGLKVRPNELRQAAINRDVLHFARIRAATNCSKTRDVETSVYARSYARFVPVSATAREDHGGNHLSLSRLKHWLPRGQAHPEVVEGAAEFHHEITDASLPQADAVFDNAAALDITVHMLDPQPPLVEYLVGPLLLQGQLWPWGFLIGMRITTSGSVNARNPRSCKSRLPAGKGYGVASAMGLSWVRPP